MKRVLFTILGCLLSLSTFAQRNQIQFLRISEDNDGLNVRREVSDREYTNGTQVDLFYTKNTKPRLVSALLIPVAGEANNLYSIGIAQLMYTPSDISRKDIVTNSRPYTAVLYASHGLISSDPVRRQRLTTELHLGVLGKAALGEQAQTWIHRRFGYERPQGWHNQLPTDVVINYLIQYEKLLVQPSPNLQIVGLVSTNVGSLSNNINGGITFRAGIFNDYFSYYERPAVSHQIDLYVPQRRFQFYFFMRPVGRLVMDDSVLQGGYFTHRRALHVIDRDDLNRGYVQFEYGMVFTYDRFGLSLSEKLITAQYRGAPSQQVGNLTLFLGL